MTKTDNIKNRIEKVYNAQLSNRAYLSVPERIKYLKNLESWILDNKKIIIEAHQSDLHKPKSEIELAEIWYVLSEIKLSLKKIKRWAKDKKVGTSTLAFFTAKSWIHYEPKGVVLIISPWNFPFNLTLGPLVSALSAGNRVIIKPSEMAPRVSSLIEKMISELFDINQVSVLEGDQTMAKALLEYNFDHIFFTGSPFIGSVVMKAASKYLTPVTLELGGKSPVIIDKTADIDMSVNKIAWGKCVNLGQSCIAPDYILIHKSLEEDFIQRLSNKWDIIYGKTYHEKELSQDLARIVNTKHWDRLNDMLENALSKGAKVVYGGKKNRENKFIEPTLLVDINFDMEIIKEEIFGPILPVLTFDTLDEALQIIAKKSNPLALYIFSNSKKNIKKIIKKTSSGGVVINEVKSHFSNLNLPFGGIGKSGMGRSHGYEGFLAFSNIRAMQENGRFSLIKLTFPPYTEWRIKLINLITKYF